MSNSGDYEEPEAYGQQLMKQQQDSGLTGKQVGDFEGKNHELYDPKCVNGQQDGTQLLVLLSEVLGKCHLD